MHNYNYDKLYNITIIINALTVQNPCHKCGWDKRK